MSEPSSRSMERARKLIVSYLIDIGVQQDECTSHEDRLGEEIARALDAARAEAWGEGFEACKAITIAIGQRARDDIAEIVRKSEERTTSPNEGVTEG